MARLSRLISSFEETAIAVLLAAMVLVTFGQVIARYVFHTGWVAALEFTTLLFSWLILFGMSYGVRIGLHLGVDTFIRLLPRRLFRLAALLGVGLSFLYAALLFDAGWFSALFGVDVHGGAYAYWERMDRAGLRLEDLSYPAFFADWMGFRSEEVQRGVAYVILPLGLALFAFRCVEAFIQILTGQRELMIAGHEAEDLVAEHRGELAD